MVMMVVALFALAKLRYFGEARVAHPFETAYLSGDLFDLLLFSADDDYFQAVVMT